MQEIRSSNPPVITAICDPNKSQARHHRSFKFGSKLKYLNRAQYYFRGRNIASYCIISIIGKNFNLDEVKYFKGRKEKLYCAI